MARQTAQNLITALYPKLSHEDELQGELNSISNQDGICQGYFLRRFQRATVLTSGSFYIESADLLGINHCAATPKR